MKKIVELGPQGSSSQASRQIDIIQRSILLIVLFVARQRLFFFFFFTVEGVGGEKV